MPRTSIDNSPVDVKKNRILSSGERQVNYKCEKNYRKQKKRFVSDIIAKVALMVKRNFDTVLNTIKDFEAGKPITTPNKKRKRSRPARDSADSFAREAIARYIYQQADNGRRLSMKELWQYVKDNIEIFMFKGSQSTLYRIVKEFGFMWRKGDPSTRLCETNEIIIKRLYFVADYMKNKRSETPRPVVYLDETWIYMNGSSTYSWLQPGTSKGVIKRPAEGRRLVVVHAGTREGFVPGADLLFATDLKRGQDYHGAMNSTTFESWVNKQLIPGIRNLGPCMVVMDNASYHSRQVERQPTTKWRKEHLIEWLRQRGVRVPNAASKTSLTALVSQHSSKFKRYVVDEMLAAEGHTVLRLPPYHCKFNPIELVWGITKSYYNKTVCERPGQGVERSKNVWKEALNKVTPEMWKNSVEHAEKIIEEYHQREAVEEDYEELIVNLSTGSTTDTASEETEADDPLPLDPTPGTSNT